MVSVHHLEDGDGDKGDAAPSDVKCDHGPCVLHKPVAQILKDEMKSLADPNPHPAVQPKKPITSAIKELGKAEDSEFVAKMKSDIAKDLSKDF